MTDPGLRASAMRRALRVVRVRADAEDVVQEAAARALRFRGHLRPGAPGEPWFLQIVSRLALDTVLRRARFPSLPPPLPAASAVASVVDRERTHAVRNAIDALPPFQRRAVVLHDVDGLTTREIAALDGVPHSTVRTRLRRGRLTLRTALADEVAP
ncbi:MAG TPA: sigma-70 family RNA polymerase sigma factor [Candidatus Sulfotelmatobacter sp.]|nr:sigma-70 family RNA polymerase sigma factor [Candidatus Sulfotelmatobacter sp.]